MKRVLLLLLVVIIISINSYSQYSKGELKDEFYASESFLLFEEYEDALPGYELNLRVDPTNNNMRYRIGQCLLNIPGRKKEAIAYLEAAVRDIDPKYREGRFKEKQAPFDAYYYLANAYRINNQLEKAISTYEIFKSNLDTKVYNIDVVNLQIESCRNAMELMKVPRYMRKINLGDLINNRLNDVNPVVSGDDSVMVFNRTGGLQDILFYTRKIDGKWTAPVNIIPELGMGFEEGNYATCLSEDGRELYIYRPEADFDGNIYVSRRSSDDRWSNLEKLNDNINTKYWESHASISHDGKKLYFTSNRKGTVGGLDIYVSEKDSTGKWGPAKNLGPTINTIYNEETPFLGENDKTLFFSSRGHFNMGGHDIFYSVLDENGEWTTPLNVGYPLNTTDDDIFYNPTSEGYTAYYALIDSAGYGLSDIYYVEIFSKDHPRKFVIRGIAQVKDLLKNFADSIKISAMNITDPETKVIVYSDPVTGEYKFELPQGNYEITYEAEGAEKTTRNLELKLDRPADSFLLPETTLPKTDFVADMEIESNRTISVTGGDTLNFPLRVEPNSILRIEHWRGDSLLYTEEFVINDPDFKYKMVPDQGDNRLVFKLEDRFDNLTESEVVVTREKAVTQQPVVRPEYSRIIAQKQIDAFTDMLKDRSDDDLSALIRKSGIEKQQYGKLDDVIAGLKTKAIDNNVDPAEVDRLALKVAVSDNVLSQSAVDILEANADGQLREILENLDIYEAGLKTWSDLIDYVSEKSGGKFGSDDLNKLASDIISGIDPGIRRIRDKVSLYGNNSDRAELIAEAMAAADSIKAKSAGEWLRNFFDEAISLGLSEEELARLLKVISAMPDTGTEDYLDELIRYSEKPLADYLREISLTKNRIRTPEDLILELLKGRHDGFFNQDILFRALSKIISAKEIPEDIIASRSAEIEKKSHFEIWIILGAGLLLFVIIFFWKRKKKEKDKKLNT